MVGMTQMTAQVPHRLRVSLAAAVGTSLLILGLWLATQAGAGGSWLDPVLDRYEPGDRVTLVGYTGGGAYGLADVAYFGYIVDRVDAEYLPISDDFEPISVGQIDLARTGHGGYLSYRAAITFAVPEDFDVGIYRFDYCNRSDGPCSTDDGRFGDLIGAYFHVGVDPDHEITRYWAPDEPEIANLEPGNEISGPGFGPAYAERERITPDLTPPARPTQEPTSVDQSTQPATGITRPRVRSEVVVASAEPLEATAPSSSSAPALLIAGGAVGAVALFSVQRRRQPRPDRP